MWHVSKMTITLTVHSRHGPSHTIEMGQSNPTIGHVVAALIAATRKSTTSTTLTTLNTRLYIGEKPLPPDSTLKALKINNNDHLYDYRPSIPESTDPAFQYYVEMQQSPFREKLHQVMQKHTIDSAQGFACDGTSSYPWQKGVSTYMNTTQSSYHRYPAGLLCFHDMGSGKTRTAVITMFDRIAARAGSSTGFTGHFIIIHCTSSSMEQFKVEMHQVAQLIKERIESGGVNTSEHRNPNSFQ